MQMDPEATPGTTRRSPARWIVALGAIAVAAGLYAVGWNIASSRLTDKLLSAMAGMDATGREVDCRNPQKGGFPLSVSLTCEALKADDVEHGVSSSLGPVTASMSLFSPTSIATSAKGPLEIRSAAGLLLGEWQDLTADVRFGATGMNALKTDATGLKATFTAPVGERNLQIDTARLSVFAEGRDGDLAAGLSGEGVRLARNGTALPVPPMKIDGALRLFERADLIGRFDRQALYGASGAVERLTADLGEGRSLSVSGPFSVSANGLLSGQVRLEARNVAAWIAAAQTALPEFADLIETGGGLLRSMAKGGPDLSIDLTLKNGKVLVAGFIPVGEIPPL